MQEMCGHPSSRKHNALPSSILHPRVQNLWSLKTRTTRMNLILLRPGRKNEPMRRWRMVSVHISAPGISRLHQNVGLLGHMGRMLVGRDIQHTRHEVHDMQPQMVATDDRLPTQSELHRSNPVALPQKELQFCLHLVPLLWSNLLLVPLLCRT